MNVYLAGQRSFGAAVFDAIAEAGHKIVGISAPAFTADGGKLDRLHGRAVDNRIPWLEAGRLTADTLPAGVDLIVAAHSHDFIGRRTRDRTTLGGIGYHPSLLPLHRGRDAVPWTIRLGDLVAGGSVYWLTDNVDAGDIAAQDWCFVRPGDTARELWRRDLFPMGVRLIMRTIEDLEDGRVIAVAQDEELATWEPSIGRPPLHRPDLLGLPAPGDRGRPVIRDADALHR